MMSIYESLFSRLEDNVAPVREAAAIALGCIVSSLGWCLLADDQFVMTFYSKLCLSVFHIIYTCCTHFETELTSLRHKYKPFFQNRYFCNHVLC